jgi:multisubunit Na+/H+ antiporter MnhB subunit
MIKGDKPGMSLIVRTVTRMTVMFIFLYGVYISSNEHVSPGGGFAGGIIIALAFMSIMLAYGKDLALSAVPQKFLAFLGSLGVFLLLGVSLLFFTIGLFAGKAVPLNLLATALKVSAGISVIFISLVLLRSGRAPKA